MIGVASAALAPGLGGCGSGGFQPLYGATSRGTRVDDELAAIDIATIPGRVGQRIRNDLLFRSAANNVAVAPRYRLEVAIREAVLTILVKIDGDASGQVYRLQAVFKLIDVKDNTVVYTGRTEAQAAFQRFTSIFSNTRARRDAENRAAREIARNLRTRLAAFISRTA